MAGDKTIKPRVNPRYTEARGKVEPEIRNQDWANTGGCRGEM